MERKSSKEYSLFFLVEGKKFKLRNLLSRSPLCCRFCCKISWQNAWVRSTLAAVLTPNMAELVHSVFFCCLFVCLFVSVHSHGFCGGMNIFSQEKRQHVNVHRHVVTKNEISIDQRMQFAVILLSN